MKTIIFFSICIFLCAVLVPQPGMAQSKKAVLNHIALYVKSLPKSTMFYHDIIQLDTIPEPFHDGRHTWFGLGDNSHLHLIEGAGNNMPHDKNNHLCFSVPSMDPVISTLNKNKIPFENWAGEAGAVTTRVDGIKQIYFRDPDGYWVEVNNDFPKN
jgi:lactoylglutathione lyase